jgi:hypothetical protein
MRLMFIIIMLVRSTGMFAQDRVFTYTYQSLVLDKGQKEIEVWSTFRGGREDYFRGIDHRIEFEIGLGKRLQTAFYLNYGYSKAIETLDEIQSVNTHNTYSFSNEWKFKLTDPVANALGSALYFEYGIGPDETELEGKIILDKQVGRTLHAFNIVGEYEFEKEFESENGELDAVTGREAYFELDYAFSFRIKNGLAAGLEARNQNQFSTSGQLESSVLSLGPCLSYYTDGFWLNLTIMPQVANLKGGGQELTEHEKLQIRLAFSFSL